MEGMRDLTFRYLLEISTGQTSSPKVGAHKLCGWVRISEEESGHGWSQRDNMVQILRGPPGLRIWVSL